MSELITVFMPTFSRCRSGHLEKAIQSVLRQTYPNFELLIVDDASVDGSKELIEYYIRMDERVKHVRMPRNIGQPALTMGIAYQKAKGDFLTFVYDDCVVTEQFLGTLLYKMRLEPTIGMAYGQAYIHWHDGRKQLIGAPFDAENLAKGNNHIPNVAVMMKREVIKHVGWYDPHFMLSRFYDWDLWRRIATHYPVGFVQEVIAEEFGTSLNDSIGHTLTALPHLFLKYAQLPRNELLHPSRIEQYDPYRLDFLEQFPWSEQEKSEVHYLLMENLVKTYNIDAIIRSANSLRASQPNILQQNKIAEKNKQLDERFHLLLEGLLFYANKQHELLTTQIADRQKYIDEQQKYIDHQQKYIDEQQRWIDARQGG